MDKPKIGLFHAIKNARANFQRLPAEAKTSYYLGGGLLIVLLALVINFIVPESEKKLQLPNQGASQSKRKGQNVADPDAVIPSSLAEEILDNRKQIQSQSQVVFNRYEETNSKLEKKKSQFLESLDVDLTPLNASEEVKEEVTSEVAVVKAVEDVRPNEKKVVDKFLGEVNQPGLEEQGENDASSSTSSYSVQALLTNPDIMKAWANSIVESDKRVLNSSKVLERGRTVVFSNTDDNEKPINASIGGSEEQNTDAETNEYMGDDFQPGRVFLARIDGFIESDTDTPFVRLKPVEGPKDWVEDAIFLAQPQLVEGKGYLINVKKVTYKNQSDNFEGVVVTPDDKRSAILVDEIESRELQRLGYLVGGGFLSGLNILANRVGTTVSNQNGTVSNVEIDKESLAVSALGGVGVRGENYLYQKLEQTKDNYIIDKNRLVGIMVVSKPTMQWLPDLNNQSVY